MCEGVNLCFGPGSLRSVKADSAGRPPARCLITYCLLSIIASLWEMAIDPRVFVCVAISFSGKPRFLTHTLLSKQREWERIVCSTEGVNKSQ